LGGESRKLDSSSGGMRVPPTSEAPTSRRRAVSPSAAAGVAGQEADDGVEDRDYAVDDRHDDAAYSVYDCHQGAADGAEDVFDLFFEHVRNVILRALMCVWFELGRDGVWIEIERW